jgi:hypothetical protein
MPAAHKKNQQQLPKHRLEPDGGGLYANTSRDQWTLMTEALLVQNSYRISKTECQMGQEANYQQLPLPLHCH